MSDLINRSDAISALHKYFSSGFDCDRWWNSTTVLFALNNVPSVKTPQEDSVSRQYLLAEIDDLADEFSEVDEHGLHSERWCGILDSKWVILNAPSVSDRPQGEWIDVSAFDAFGGDEATWMAHGNPTAFHYCSECKEQTRIDEFGEEILSNYCPNCGARMKGADDDRND